MITKLGKELIKTADADSDSIQTVVELLNYCKTHGFNNQQSATVVKGFLKNRYGADRLVLGDQYIPTSGNKKNIFIDSKGIVHTLRPTNGTPHYTTGDWGTAIFNLLNNGKISGGRSIDSNSWKMVSKLGNIPANVGYNEFIDKQAPAVTHGINSDFLLLNDDAGMKKYITMYNTDINKLYSGNMTRGTDRHIDVPVAGKIMRAPRFGELPPRYTDSLDTISKMHGYI